MGGEWVDGWLGGQSRGCAVAGCGGPMEDLWRTRGGVLLWGLGSDFWGSLRRLVALGTAYCTTAPNLHPVE